MQIFTRYLLTTRPRRKTNCIHGICLARHQNSGALKYTQNNSHSAPKECINDRLPETDVVTSNRKIIKRMAVLEVNILFLYTFHLPTRPGTGYFLLRRSSRSCAHHTPRFIDYIDESRSGKGFSFDNER